jgi:hypothetical protein
MNGDIRTLSPHCGSGIVLIGGVHEKSALVQRAKIVAIEPMTLNVMSVGGPERSF